MICLHEAIRGLSTVAIRGWIIIKRRFFHWNLLRDLLLLRLLFLWFLFIPLIFRICRVLITIKLRGQLLITSNLFTISFALPTISCILSEFIWGVVNTNWGYKFLDRCVTEFFFELLNFNIIPLWYLLCYTWLNDYTIL